TIRSPCSVDRSRFRILQDGNRLDVSRVYIRKRIVRLSLSRDLLERLVVDKHPVNDIKRIAARVNRRRSADAEKETVARNTGVGADLHTCRPTLDLLIEAGGRLVGDFRSFDGRHRTDNGTL